MSCGSGALGRRKKQKMAKQALEKTIFLAIERLRSATKIRRINFYLGASIRNNRFIFIVKRFARQGFRINALIDKSLKVYGAVRPPKLRRV
jgi:hypothetical protein